MALKNLLETKSQVLLEDSFEDEILLVVNDTLNKSAFLSFFSLNLSSIINFAPANNGRILNVDLMNDE